ncbi:hypothetical protein [Nocardioides gilvus]|uniref:hypothetical protein n=1 Tax=Nocardioides gilvus TaxID=1735589 RepID=UPI000D74325D|nr:hypothetical protein [Nocardioides gilvus]
MIRPVRALGAVLLVAALATGCGAEEKAAEEAAEAMLSKEGSKVDIDGEKVTVEDGEGNVMNYGEGVELPDDFPEEVPLPQGDYKVNSVYEEGERTTMMLAFEAPDMESLEEHLRSGLTEAGYTIEDGMRIDQESGKQVHFTATSAVRELSIVLMVTPEEEATAVYTLAKAEG